MQPTSRRAARLPQRMVTLVAFAAASPLPSASAMEASALFKLVDPSIVVVLAEGDRTT